MLLDDCSGSWVNRTCCRSCYHRVWHDDDELGSDEMLLTLLLVPPGQRRAKKLAPHLKSTLLKEFTPLHIVVDAHLLGGDDDAERAGAPLLRRTWEFGQRFSSGSLPPMFWHLVETILPLQGVDTCVLCGSTKCHSLAMLGMVVQVPTCARAMPVPCQCSVLGTLCSGMLKTCSSSAAGWAIQRCRCCWAHT